jgi:hypothetical protein
MGCDRLGAGLKLGDLVAGEGIGEGREQGELVCPVVVEHRGGVSTGSATGERDTSSGRFPVIELGPR